MHNWQFDTPSIQNIGNGILITIIHHGMVDNANEYGSAVIYTINFTVAWLTTQINMEVLGSFQVFSVVVCTWLTTQKYGGQPASVEVLRLTPSGLGR